MKENLSKKQWKFGRGRNFGKCPKLAREAPHATQKIKKHIGPERALAPNLGPGPNFSLEAPGERVCLLCKIETATSVSGSRYIYDRTPL